MQPCSFYLILLSARELGNKFKRENIALVLYELPKIQSAHYRN